ncbi:MAG: hypothetical protein HKN30_10315 [Sulfitobacter sp.]|nr:hypothetical protein [Sulfitobacter sp.]
MKKVRHHRQNTLVPAGADDQEPISASANGVLQNALDHADRIFGTGEELIATLQGAGKAKSPLRVGTESTLSRNFQLRFLQPVLGAADVDLKLTSGNVDNLILSLNAIAPSIAFRDEIGSGLIQVPDFEMGIEEQF